VFDKGETFSGIDYDKGLEATHELKKIFPDKNLAAIALKWILMFDEVSCIIPGASNPQQVTSNLEAVDLPDLLKPELEAVKEVSDKLIRNPVHYKW
jgi:aryl-alcohol dehydrogenase-like predicted oxidoreductase